MLQMESRGNKQWPAGRFLRSRRLKVCVADGYSRRDRTLTSRRGALVLGARALSDRPPPAPLLPFLQHVAFAT